MANGGSHRAKSRKNLLVTYLLRVAMTLGMGIIQMKTGLQLNKIMGIERSGSGVEFWVFAWNNAYVLSVLENLVELFGYGLGHMRARRGLEAPSGMYRISCPDFRCILFFKGYCMR